MPSIVDGPLAGLYWPDYPDGSLVNLMASIIRSRGGRSPHPSLADLSIERLAAGRHLLCIVIDGLGEAQLASYLADHPGSPFFGCHHRRVISTLFPATTASVVTTLLTGCSPAEHGVLGWYLNLPDLGLSSSVLLSQSRLGMPLAPDGFNLRNYLAIPSHLATVAGRRVLLSYGVIPSSRYSTACGSWDEVRAFDDLDGLATAATAVVARDEPSLIHVYWPPYDGQCHEQGVDHPATVDHLARVDAMLARLVDGLSGRAAGLVVTADHGIRDTPVEQRIDLAALPGFYDCLATLPCGDAGHASCFVRPRQQRRFLELVRERLSAACHLVSGEWLLEQGVFGTGTPHPALGSRVGDWFLVARDRQAFAAPPGGSPPHFMVGNHGGMSEPEMRIPLYVVEP